LVKKPVRAPGQARRERALATRRKVLEAAYRLFCERGYGATTMGDIAAEAGVAVQTLYFTFHHKGAIMSETLGAAIFGFETWQGPPREPIDAAAPEMLRTFHPWFGRYEEEPDARQALVLFVEASTDAMRRGAPLVAAMHAAAQDPDARAVFELGERRRVETFGTVVKILSKKKGGLRPGLTVARATDLMLVLFSATTTQALLERGWGAVECRRFFTDVLSHQLLP
jgi:AcrR family transcriptional regulator